MLILTRRCDESLMIGDEVKVTILSISGKQVRVGIEAPKEFAVHRKEVSERIMAQAAVDMVLQKDDKKDDG